MTARLLRVRVATKTPDATFRNSHLGHVLSVAVRHGQACHASSRLAGRTEIPMIPTAIPTETDTAAAEVAGTIAALQRRVNEALVVADAETLQALVAEDCQIVGPKGYMISRDQWARVREGGYDYEQILLYPVRENLVVHERAAIRCDVVESRCSFRGELIEGLFRVTQAWVTDRGDGSSPVCSTHPCPSCPRTRRTPPPSASTDDPQHQPGWIAAAGVMRAGDHTTAGAIVSAGEVPRRRARAHPHLGGRNAQEEHMNGTGMITGGALAGTPTGTWKIDPAHTSVTFSVRHLMSKVRGQFSEVDGQIIIGAALASCSVQASIATASVNTGMQMRDDDLRSARFFDSTSFPSMGFAGTDITEEGARITLVGDLTIRDVTRPVSIEVEFLGYDETGLQGEPRIGFSGRTTVRRSDFKVGDSWVEGSKVVVGDTVTIELDIEAFLEQ